MAVDKNIFRDYILDCYDLDINESECHFSTQNYAFVFPEKPFMVRVGVTANKIKTRNTALSEAMWVEALKEYSETICEPTPSKYNNIVEEFKIDGRVYRATMFRTAHGKMKDMDKVDPMYLIAVGDLLGRIHAASMDLANQGFLYQRPDWEVSFRASCESAKPIIGTKEPQIISRAENIIDRISKIERKHEWFGMIHGDFHTGNFFVDNNNIWVFDFDNCEYGYYMYDIASVIITWLMKGYKMPKPRREVMIDDILPYFRMGYELHVKHSSEYWNMLDIFIELRQCLTATALAGIDESGVLNNIEATREFIYFQLRSDDIFSAIDTALINGGGLGIRESTRIQCDDNRKADIFGNSIIIPLTGKLDSGSTPELEDKVDELIAAECSAIVFDCSGLLYLSSAGLRVILKSRKKLENIKLINVSPPVLEVLKITGMTRVLVIENN